MLFTKSLVLSAMFAGVAHMAAVPDNADGANRIQARAHLEVVPDAGDRMPPLSSSFFFQSAPNPISDPGTQRSSSNPNHSINTNVPLTLSSAANQSELASRMEV